MILTNPKTGETLESSLTDYQAAKICDTLDNQFAQKLVRNFDKLTEAMRFWLHKLAIEGKGEPLPDGSYERICQMFEKVDLEYPCIRFKTPEGTIRFNQYRGCIRIQCGHNLVGRITPDSNMIKRGMHERTELLVKLVSVDPLAAAVLWGLRTNRCCFCFRELTDERSVSVGYGPICADRWHLPWGDDTEGAQICS